MNDDFRFVLDEENDQVIPDYEAGYLRYSRIMVRSNFNSSGFTKIEFALFKLGEIPAIIDTIFIPGRVCDDDICDRVLKLQKQMFPSEKRKKPVSSAAPSAPSKSAAPTLVGKICWTKSVRHPEWFEVEVLRELPNGRLKVKRTNSRTPAFTKHSAEIRWDEPPLREIDLGSLFGGTKNEKGGHYEWR